MKLALVLVMLVGSVAHAQMPVPPWVTKLAKQNDATFHAGYLDATLYDHYSGDASYRVDPSGVADSTKGLQQAINDAMSYGLATYLPPGTYLVSDTLVGEAQRGTTACVTAAKTADGKYYVSQTPSLVGSGVGARPLVKLKDGATGFGAGSTKPLLNFYDYNPTGQDSLPLPFGQYDCLMWAVLRDVDFDLGNNQGGIGVVFAAAQSSYMENVRINAGAAYAGVDGVPTTNVIVNVEVDGGQYGIIPDPGSGTSFVGITLRNQSVAGLYIHDQGNLALTGFSIDEPNGVFAVLNDEWNYQSAELSLVDGAITIAGNAKPAISNVGNDLYLRNVYVTTPGSLIESASRPAIAGSGATSLISEYSYSDSQAVAISGKSPTTSYALVDGVLAQSERVTTAKSATLPTDLVSRHLPGALPVPFASGVIDATSYGADPDGHSDSTAAIQKAIDAGHDVFLPRGNYILSGTLQLRVGTRLFGVPGQRSAFIAPTWSPHAVLSAFIKSDPRTTYLGDVHFSMTDATYDQTYLSALDWNAGRSSVVHQIQTDCCGPGGANHTSAARSLITIEGTGGGKLYGVDMSLGVPLPGIHTLTIENTTAPITLYGPNPEHGSGLCLIDLEGAANVRIFGVKSENTCFLIHKSQNVLFASHTGNSDWFPMLQIVDSTNIVASNFGEYTGQQSTKPLVTASPSGGAVSQIDGADHASLFAYGTFDDTKFPYCGDAICDSNETATSCPTDCSTTTTAADASEAPAAAIDGAMATQDGGVAAALPDAAGAPVQASGCDVTAGTRGQSPGLLLLLGLAFALVPRLNRRGLRRK